MYPVWAVHASEKADYLAKEAAARASVCPDLAQRVEALDVLAEQIRGRLAAIQSLWWTHYPVKEEPADVKRARRQERSAAAFQHVLDTTSH